MLVLFLCKDKSDTLLGFRLSFRINLTKIISQTYLADFGIGMFRGFYSVSKKKNIRKLKILYSENY